ncbi:MAG: ATP-binding protein [Candidatus Sulfotelmatobacter sp.]
MDEARSRDSGGFGLGLPTAKWAVEAHGGTIHVKTSSPTGAIFCIKLPVVTGIAINHRASASQASFLSGVSDLSRDLRNPEVFLNFRVLRGEYSRQPHLTD